MITLFVQWRTYSATHTFPNLAHAAAWADGFLESCPDATIQREA